jgi:hypothetical protein
VRWCAPPDSISNRADDVDGESAPDHQLFRDAIDPAPTRFAPVFACASLFPARFLRRFD